MEIFPDLKEQSNNPDGITISHGYIDGLIERFKSKAEGIKKFRNFVAHEHEQSKRQGEEAHDFIKNWGGIDKCLQEIKDTFDFTKKVFNIFSNLISRCRYRFDDIYYRDPRENPDNIARDFVHYMCPLPCEKINVQET